MMLPRSPHPNAIQDSTGRRGMLLVSPRGRIQFKSGRAARWLKDFSVSRSDRLPEAMIGWLEDVVSSGRPVRFIMDRAGRELCFQVICCEANMICVLLEQKEEAVESNVMQSRLTQRQIEVLTWVARGKTNAEIAGILSLKTKTIGKYLERIFPKLGVENRTAAASFVLGTNQAI
jgi:DNA-binding CsgD family transcriptional regulator